MMPFNIPLLTGKEIEYVKKSVSSEKITGYKQARNKL